MNSNAAILAAANDLRMKAGKELATETGQLDRRELYAAIQNLVSSKGPEVQKWLKENEPNSVMLKEGL